MLVHLNIRDLAVIDSLDIEFHDGFNVITGETGAGKSILIKALGLLLGQKATPEVIRKGKSEAIVCATFQLSKEHPLSTLLSERELAVADGSVLIRRKITQKSRSQAWINDIPVSLSLLKDLGVYLIDIFSQHENHRLLDAKEHTRLLDQFLESPELSIEMSERYHQLLDELKALRTDLEEIALKQREQDYLSFRLEELETFDPSQADYQTCYNVCKQSAGSHVYQQALELARQNMEPETDVSPASMVWQTVKALEGVESLKELTAQARELATGLDELGFSLARLQEDDASNEVDLEEAQTRLAGYQDLFRKLSAANVDELLAYRERLQTELDFIATAQVRVKQRLASLAKQADSLQVFAKKLSKARHKAAVKVKRSIERELSELSMPGATLDVAFNEIKRTHPSLEQSMFDAGMCEDYARVSEATTALGETGLERVQFMLASNPGEACLPLDKIASGGEASRIMLALKRSLAAGADSCLLVFDEIDSGISGRVADTVGKKLKDLANRFQVLCISHLAQVGAYAQAHLKVDKQRVKGRTVSTIRMLNAKESNEELARLLSGPELTKHSLANAKTLIARANQ